MWFQFTALQQMQSRASPFHTQFRAHLETQTKTFSKSPEIMLNVLYNAWAYYGCFLWIKHSSKLAYHSQ